MQCISDESYAEDGDWLVDVRMPAKDWYQLEKHLASDLATYVINKH